MSLEEKDFNDNKIHFYVDFYKPEFNSKAGINYWELILLPMIMLSGSGTHTFISINWLFLAIGIMFPGTPKFVKDIDN